MRTPSTTALQSLLLLNSNFTLDLSRRLASLCINECAEAPQTQTREIFRRVFARLPTSQEELDCHEFLLSQAAMAEQLGSHDPALAALTELCRALFNSNEFLYID